MSCIYWNCQGLGVPLTVHTLGDILRKHNPDLVFLSETRSTPQRIESLKQKWNMYGMAVDKVGKSGGLALLWRKEIVVTLLSFSNNHVDVEVCLKAGYDKWRFTGFYGFPEQSQRRRSWDLLCHLRTQSTLPWLIGGDYNEILSNSEKVGGIPKCPGHIEAFRIALETCNLSDLGFRGTSFTWSNNRQHPHTVRSRLDRVCANSLWCSRFPNATVDHMEYPGSDHIPLLLTLEAPCPQHHRRGRRPFRFEAMWIKREECEEIIHQQWTAQMGTNPMETVLLNNANCRLALMKWSKHTVKQPQRRIEELQKKLHDLHAGIQSDESKNKIQSLRTELEKLYEENDIYWRQRSRVQWMREGDRNTSFFHAKATTRHRVNKVDRIKDSMGEWRDQPHDIEQVISSYFSEIFRSTNPGVEEIDEIMSHIEPRISSAASLLLSRPFTAAEVHRAISQMAPLKSPGPDGLPVLFYTKHWHILGSDVTSCILDFLNNKTLPPLLNFTYIVLIPKIKHPEKITDYRPISLCNVIYKFGSKVIANRLKLVLPELISPTQSAFVQKRLITDNVLVAFEINHFIKSISNNRKNYMAIKLDISKAYDRVEWSFLQAILSRLGLPPPFIDLIMLCISSVSYSFLFNGTQFGSTRPSRGLRQGDPLSPYLFICCTEGLIAMINKAVVGGDLHGIQIAQSAPTISHLCFADDTLFFCEASVADSTTLKWILDKYALASGQEINHDKSTMTFSPATPQDLKDSIHQILGFKTVDRHDKYLGMPCSMGRTKKEIFGYLRDRVWAKVKGWGEKQLSRAGKEVLIKSVLQSIPTYIMSCFLLPKGLINEIESAIRRYWWGNEYSKGVAWLSWRKTCMPKSEGGIGFREMKSFNLSLLAKQGWRLMTEPNLLLTRVLKARYFPNGDFLSADIGSRPSATWRSILAARQCLKMGLRVRIGNGSSTSIWCDPWITDDGCLRVITRRPIHSVFPDSVADLIDPASRTWNTSVIHNVFWPIDIDRILSVPIGSHQVADRLVWHYTPHGRFTVNSCYKLILSYSASGSALGDRLGHASSGVQSPIWRKIWALHIPPKVRIFLWRAALNILPTMAELYRRKIATSSCCHRCGQMESFLHIMLECRGVGFTWQQHPFENVGMINVANFETWFNHLAQTLHPDLLCLASVVMWKIWNIRNREIYGEETTGLDDILSWSKSFIGLYEQANVQPRLDHSSAHPSMWLPPAQGSIKINTDAAFPVGKDFFTTSMIARDWKGECIWWSVEKFAGRPKPVDGEAKAVLQALRKAVDVGWNSIVVEGDCMRVIEPLKNGESNLASFGALLEDCLDVARCFHSISFSFIRRTGNSLANAIAKSYDNSCTEGSSLPPSLALFA